MPSPVSNEIEVLIHGTHWLDPIVTEPVVLPKSIPVGETVDVPGVLRAFIMQERSPRNAGQAFSESDEIQLIATAMVLDRTLPDFSGGTKIAIQYPLELDAPKYLDCVAQGDQVTFSWTVCTPTNALFPLVCSDSTSSCVISLPNHTESKAFYGVVVVRVSLILVMCLILSRMSAPGTV
jgi:hypothetical protein